MRIGWISMRAMLLIAAVALPSNGANAQDGTEVVAARTPESAQRFLASLSPVDMQFVLQDPKVRIPFLGIWKVRLSSDDNFCDTKFEFDGTEAVASPVKNFNIDWSKSTGVRYNPTDVLYTPHVMVGINPSLPLANEAIMHDLSKKPQEILYFSVAGKNERMAAAMTYLLEACDKSKDTGF